MNVISGSRKSVLSRFTFLSCDNLTIRPGRSWHIQIEHWNRSPEKHLGLKAKAINRSAAVPNGALEPLATVDTFIALIFAETLSWYRNRAREAVRLFAGSNHKKSLTRNQYLSLACRSLPSRVVMRHVKGAGRGSAHFLWLVFLFEGRKTWD